MRRLKLLEDENSKLKKLVADLSRQGDAAGCSAPKTVRPGHKRELVTKVCCEWDVSIRRAYAVLVVSKSTYHYKLRRNGQADLKKRIKEIAETRMRYDYRRVHVVLQREGWMTNVKRTYRLYSELYQRF
jgi:putative transposase